MRDTRCRPSPNPTPTTQGCHSRPRARKGVIRAEAANDSPAGADDAHDAVVAAEDQAVGAGADGRDLVALEERAGAAAGVGVVVFVGGGGVGGGCGRGRGGVVGELDLRGVEEVEGPPLREGGTGGLVELGWVGGVGSRGGKDELLAPWSHLCRRAGSGLWDVDRRCRDLMCS